MMTFSHLLRLILAFDKALLICKRSKLNESGFAHFPTKVESAFSHGFFYIIAQKGYQLNESGLTD